MRLFGQLSELVSVLFRKNSQEITLRPSQSVTYTAARSVDLPPINASEVLVGETATQTIGNKNIETSTLETNTTFVDATTPAKALAFDLSGSTSVTTTFTISSTSARVITFPNATTTLVGTDNVATLSNKTLDNTTTANLKDSLFTVQDDGDATKQFKVQLSGITTGNTRTWTVPDSSDTFVGLVATQTLQNKTLDTTTTLSILTSNLFIRDFTDTTKVARFDASSITTGTTRNFTFPDADATLVGTATAQTLTNKTISGASNTISNINLASQVTGTLPIANGGTGQTTATAAFDNLAPTTTKGDVIVHNGTDNIRLAVGTNGQVLTADSAETSGLRWGASAVVPGTAGGVYSDGAALQSIAFSGNANEVFGVNAAGTSAEYKALTAGSAGTDFTIDHTAGVVTFNIPSASASARGLVTTGTQTLTGLKTFDTGAIIKGVSDASSAATGYVGEYIESIISTPTNVPAVSGSYGDATSISLTAGDWDISLLVLEYANGATITEFNIGISTSSGTGFGDAVITSNFIQYVGTPATREGFHIPVYRKNISSTTTMYAKLQAVYSAATPQFTARLSARRVR